eukprot:TRINITY_DN58036_c0_g1_i1.p1 TRINITY_DN58036_c0_g1~~TRINITY_DN58036_c0_g1_i1.p1  ORF type:complete len:370 (-),score=45.18 TRINITY_DN58036_c0_g1_i1:38-1147(-)
MGMFCRKGLVNATRSLRNLHTLDVQQVAIVKTSCNNIIFNLATEEYLYEKSKILYPMLFLWRNDKTIVIGKHQNPWKECRIKDMKEDGINLARRKSGGGAVYQDLGNTCFSFLNPITPENEKIDFKYMNTDVLVDAMKELRISGAEPSGRNDILVNGKKVSGSAYKLRPKKRTLHHGTMLLSLDKSAAQKYLSPNVLKLKSKGVESVRARIMNLNEVRPDITHEIFCDAMCTAFKKKHSGSPVLELDLNESDLRQIKEIEDIYKETSTWEWRFGETPEFTHTMEHKFDWGLIELCFKVEKGHITQAKIFSDCMYPDFIDYLNEWLEKIDIDYSAKALDGIFFDYQKRLSSSALYQSYIYDIVNLIHSEI